MKLKVVPRDEISRIELADKGISSKTAYLIREERGYQKSEIHAHPYIVHGLDAEVPTVKVKIRAAGGEIVRQRDLSEKIWWYAGSSPFRQAIYAFLRDMEHVHKLASIDDICKNIIEVNKFLFNEPESWEMVRDIVKKSMWRAGVVTTSHGFYKTGVPPRLGKKVKPVETGYDPNVKEIWDFVEKRGVASIKEISDHMITGIGWIKRPSTVSSYVTEMLEKEYLAPIAKDIYEVGQIIEVFSGG